LLSLVLAFVARVGKLFRSLPQRYRLVSIPKKLVGVTGWLLLVAFGVLLAVYLVLSVAETKFIQGFSAGVPNVGIPAKPNAHSGRNPNGIPE
jgi:hypothetical protein